MKEKEGRQDMQYRTFGQLDWRGSVLGFGSARFPSLENDRRSIDEPATIEMLRYAIDHGVNYVDTAYDYRRGHSERVIGKALQGEYRDKVWVATKLPCWLVEIAEDFVEGDFDDHYTGSTRQLARSERTSH
jgi:predicted aldo/keto reductase-like oxidoreductase